MLTVHRWRQTWIEQVDKYVVLTDFIRQKLVEGGIPDAKLVTKPNSIHPDPGYEDVAMTEGDYLLYVGRLSEEKGITTLLAAWRQYAGCAQDTPVLKIVGDGPLAPEVAEAAAQLPRLEWLGHQPSERVLPLMRHALGLVCPSTCYEGFPMVIVEAYAVGLPVIASEIGSLAALISPGRTGLLSRPGDASDLAANIAWLAAHGPERLQMRRGARAEFDSRYTGQRNYEALMAIYGSVVGHVA
jgi:glycosyltransferase involved in cell wall biosynthesis